METAGYIIVGAICERITFGAFLFGKFDISMACNGMLAGLVAITASGAFVGLNSAVIIGMLAGILVCGGSPFQ